MSRRQRLDEKDRQIISLLVKNPEASQSYIATQVELSQPSVGSRIHRLKDSGAIAYRVGLHLFKHIGLHLVKVDIKARNVGNVLRRLKGCPYYLNGLIISGTHNLCLFLAGDDIATLDALVEKHVRRDPDVSDVIFEVVTSASNDIIIPVDLSLKEGDSHPCGTKCDCAQCASYEMGRCTGCPVSEYYRGTFWR